MTLSHSRKKPAKTPDPNIAQQIEGVSSLRLRNHVEWLSVPRHVSQSTNASSRREISKQLQKLGFRVEIQGTHQNVVAYPKGEPTALVGAHYDSVIGTPGADDNASAVAALLEAARILGPSGSTMFIAFNAEEVGLLGSKEFEPHTPKTVREAHILEMIGYTSATQSAPANFPVKIPEKGDFLALLSNAKSNPLCDRVVQKAKTYGLLPTIGLKVHLGIENLLPVLHRSDHSPFWKGGRIPCLMWTDTSEFRNPHYHQPSDLPETLDYGFLTQVTQLLVCHLSKSKPASERFSKLFG